MAQSKKQQKASAFRAKHKAKLDKVAAIPDVPEEDIVDEEPVAPEPEGKRKRKREGKEIDEEDEDKVKKEEGKEGKKEDKKGKAVKKEGEEGAAEAEKKKKSKESKQRFILFIGACCRGWAEVEADSKVTSDSRRRGTRSRRTLRRSSVSLAWRVPVWRSRTIFPGLSPWHSEHSPFPLLAPDLC